MLLGQTGISHLLIALFEVRENIPPTFPNITYLLVSYIKLSHVCSDGLCY